MVSEDDISTATVPIPSVSQTMDRPTQNGKKATIENESEAFDPPANSADTDNMERRSPLEMEVVSLSDKRADEDITMANYNLANDLAASVGDYDKIVRDFDNEFSEPGRPNAGEGGSDEENGDGHLRDAESDTVEKQTKTKGKGRCVVESSDEESFFGSDEENEEVDDAMASLVPYSRDRPCSYAFKGPRSTNCAVCAGERRSRETS